LHLPDLRTGGYTTASPADAATPAGLDFVTHPGSPDGRRPSVKNCVVTLLAAVLLASAWGCRDDRNDDTGKGEKQERLDATRGTPPGH
jgi:hypothetical protein